MTETTETNDDARRAIELPLIYTDEHLVAIVKPAGMFVHRTDRDRSDEAVVLQLVRDQLGEYLYPIHRLDRATSGVLLLARSSEAAAAMSTLFAERNVVKTYQALVRGHCDDAGCINLPLVSARGRGLPDSHPHAVPQVAITKYRTLQRFEVPIANNRHSTSRTTLLEVTPQTGRFHQIRRHFNYVSHPVIGDSSHGDTRHNAIYKQNFGLKHLMLAAVRLRFRHPFNHHKIDLRCAAAESFVSVIQRLARVSNDRNSPHG